VLKNSLEGTCRDDLMADKICEDAEDSSMGMSLFIIAHN
jgi:hypothetical protein